MSHRRSRASLTSPPPTSSTSSFPSPIGADDISTLSLPEVRERLARNTRVLNTGLFASPTPPAAPSPPISSSPQFGIPTPSARTLPRPGVASAGNSPTDSVRDRLLGVRRQLMEREKELLMAQTADGMGGLQLGGVDTAPLVPQNGSGGGISPNAMDEDEEEEAESSSMAGRRYSHTAPRPPPTGPANGQQSKASGKAAAMMNIREREKGYAPNGLILPVSESIALAARDFDHQTASRLSSLSLGPAQYGLDMGGIPRSSSSPKSRRHRALAYPDEPSNADANLTRLRTGEDENARAQALARVNAFMSYKSGRYDDDDDDDEDEGLGFDGVDGDGVDGMFDFEEPDYPESSALDGRRVGGQGGKGKRRERGTGEEVDVYGEDDERFAEGNGDDDEGEGMDI